MAYIVSIFLENKIGHFERVTTILKENCINIRSMAINDTANGWGILDLITDDPQKALDKLSEKGVSVALRKVIALEMLDDVGGLNDLLIELSRAGINFNNAFGRIVQERKTAILVLSVEDYEESLAKLKSHGLTILDDAKVYGN